MDNASPYNPEHDQPATDAGTPAADPVHTADPGTRPGVEPRSAQPLPPAAHAAYPAAAAAPLRPKRPLLAAFLSLFPGAGNIYNGLYLRGVIFFVLVGTLIGLTAEEHPLFGFAVAFTWIFNILDAYRQAALINDGYAEDSAAIAAGRRSHSSAQEKVFAGSVLLIIGLVAALDRYFNLSFDWIIRLWPLVLIGVGAWLLVSALRGRKDDQQDTF